MKRPATSPKENMAKKNPVTENYEADPDSLVKIELETLNGKPFYGQVTDDELMYIWIEVLKRTKAELFGTSSTKTLTRNVRAIYKLNKPAKLKDMFQSERFGYEKYLDDGSVEAITGKILGFNAIKAAEIGDLVKVSIKTNFNTEPGGILKWLKLYGATTSHHDYVVNPATGLKSDVFEAELVLHRHIPEYLPIFGQKAQVFYPGMPRMCNRCYVPGHLRRDCNNVKKDWVAYIVGLLADGLDPSLIGSWKNAVTRWKNANQNPRKEAASSA